MKNLKSSLLFLTLIFLISCQSFKQNNKSNSMAIYDEPTSEVERVLKNYLWESDEKDLSYALLRSKPDLQAAIKKQELKILSGPMVGSTTDKSTRIWLRTLIPSRVRVEVSENKNFINKIISKNYFTSDENDLSESIEINGLKSFRKYYYQIFVNEIPVLPDPLPSFTTYPEKGSHEKFSVAFGGCSPYYPPAENIWTTILTSNPLAFLALGDNHYIDAEENRSLQRFHYYRRGLRSDYKTMISRVSNYAIWDDHDFSKSDSAGGADPFVPSWKPLVWEVFHQNWNNPSYGNGRQYPGVWFDFVIGDVQFFMTDGRYYRDFKNGTMLGSVQKQWLLSSLKNSKAKFKIIVSGTLWNDFADKKGADSWLGVSNEREEIFSLLEKNKINGVVLLSADRHRTDVYRIERPNGYPLYEFESSKLTNSRAHPVNPKAIFSINDSFFFGLLSFDFNEKNPTLTYQAIDITGVTRFTKVLSLSELQVK